MASEFIFKTDQFDGGNVDVLYVRSYFKAAVGIEPSKVAAAKNDDPDNLVDVVTIRFERDLTDDEQAAFDAALAAFDKIVPVRAARIRMMRGEVKAYIYARYDDGVQSSLNALSVEGIANGFKNRLALIGSILSWVKSILGYYYGQKAAILAATTHEDVEAVKWDFTQFDATDPQVALQQVVGVVD